MLIHCAVNRLTVLMTAMMFSATARFLRGHGTFLNSTGDIALP